MSKSSIVPMRRRMLLGLLGLALAAPSQAGLTNLVNQVTGSADGGRLAVVLVDVSSSVGAEDWRLYEQAFSELLASSRSGDRVVLAAVGSTPGSRFLVHADRTMARVNRRLEDEATLKRARAALSEDFQALRAKSSVPAKATYLLDAIGATESLFEQGRRVKQRTVLVVLSDMVEESPVANFARVSIDDGYIKQLIDTRRAQKLLPNLQGVGVHAVGASGNTAQHMAALKTLWTQYFSAANAQLLHYARSLPKI